MDVTQPQVVQTKSDLLEMYRAMVLSGQEVVAVGFISALRQRQPT